MSLSPGTRIGPYEVVNSIGAGGMGEVYRARDIRLGRDVALKVLPATFTSDPDRRMRFEREARSLALLNHPHIAQIHGLEESAIVMEFVDGQTLADAIRSAGPVPVGEAISIARQIADALESAHEAGIVHRDLKPANIKLRQDGTVKVLDFGLAKAIEGDGSSRISSDADASALQTVTSPAVTQHGVILGTAAYMSPEQARGRVVDKRSDIWAFGCVLYEMLTGRSPFPGETITDVIAAVVKNEPDLELLPADVPPRVRSLLSRCLQKDSRARLRDIGDARWELDQRDEPANLASSPSGRDRSRVAVLAVFLAAVSIASAVFAFRTWPLLNARDPAPLRLSVTFPDGAPMQLGQPLPSLALSPDGTTIIYTATGPDGPQLWMRRLDQFAPTPLAGTGGGRNAAFSPDGRWIAFHATRQLKKMQLSGVSPVVVSEVEGAVFGLTWISNDEIVFAKAGTSDRGLWRVPASGGNPQLVAVGNYWFPDALPDGRAVVATTDNASAVTASELTIVAVNLASGNVTRLFDGGVYARYAPTGHILYLRQNQLLAAVFDSSQLKVDDDRLTVANDAFVDPTYPSGNFAVSPSGVLAYAPGDGKMFRRTLITIGADGPRTIVSEPRYYQAPRVSPDGQRFATMIRSWKDTAWIVDQRGTLARLTTQDWQSAQSPIWSHDGRRVAFAVMDDKLTPNLAWAPSDGSGAEERLSTSTFTQTPTSFSLDGRLLVFTQASSDTGADMFVMSLADRTVRPLLQTRFDESAGVVSPDGHWIAFQSNRTGSLEVFVAPFPAMQPITQVSIAGGAFPRWPRGPDLYFRAPSTNTIWSVDVGTGGKPAFSQPRAVIQVPATPSAAYDVMPDGRILIVDRENVSINDLRVVTNWANGLGRIGASPR